MELKVWLKQKRHTYHTFISELNELLVKEGQAPYSWQSARAWATGTCIPRPQAVVAINRLSDGAVTYADHVAANRPYRKRFKVKV